MQINSATLIYFSPTGTTIKILNAIVKGIELGNTQIIDLTIPKVRNEVSPNIQGDIVLIGVPVYEEIIPKILNSYLKSLKGNKKPVVLVAVYGNIGEGIALNELHSITKNAEFNIVAAASFIGEHSFSTEWLPIAEGRPTYVDLEKAKDFGKNIKEKLVKLNELNSNDLVIPKGKMPLIAKLVPENSARIITKTPDADMSLCNKCGVCFKLCPMAAINEEDLKINERLCLRCFCCVKKCPKKARQITYMNKFLASQVLTKKNRIKNEPKIYL